MHRHRYTLHRLLVASDLQAGSRQLLDVAASLALRGDLEVHLVTVVEQRIAGLEAVGGRLEALSHEAQRAIAVQASALEGRGVRVASHVRSQGGRADTRIVERAAHTASDLVLVGSVSQGGHGHRLGSVADRVVRSSPVPVLVHRGPTLPPARRIACLLDFSDPSRHAARVLHDWLPVLADLDHGATLEFLHVGDSGLLALDSSLEPWAHAQVTMELEHLALEPRAGLEVSGRVVWARHPVDGVVETAVAEGYDLIVVGTHGKGPITRALVGSVAIGVCQGAPCPVLVVPPTD